MLKLRKESQNSQDVNCNTPVLILYPFHFLYLILIELASYCKIDYCSTLFFFGLFIGSSNIKFLVNVLSENNKIIIPTNKVGWGITKYFPYILCLSDL